LQRTGWCHKRVKIRRGLKSFFRPNVSHSVRPHLHAGLQNKTESPKCSGFACWSPKQKETNFVLYIDYNLNSTPNQRGYPYDHICICSLAKHPSTPNHAWIMDCAVVRTVRSLIGGASSMRGLTQRKTHKICRSACMHMWIRRRLPQ
jgi:hypothetical protein